MCSIFESREKGYKLPEQILLNFLVLFPILHKLPSDRKFNKTIIDILVYY